MITPILCLGIASFVISLIGTFAMIRIAPRIGFVDKPGGRKIHANPKPLGGGVAITWGFVLPMIAALTVVSWPPFHPSRLMGIEETEHNEALLNGVRRSVPLARAFIAACLALHVLGLVDDRKALGPFIKLLIQVGTTAAIVIGCDLRALTAIGYWPSVVVTVVWIVAITNAFNFLDNMDGLSAGVAAICTTAFLVTALTIQQWFVAATLALLLGAVLGFLVWNFPPAKIFMGDSGSMVIGFILGVLTVRTTFLPPGTNFGAGWYAVFAPVIVLALPLYDMIVVSITRVSRGKSPFVGDTNHFSHRLVARGMSRRTAVLCLYLVTAATSIAAILLPHVQTTFGAMLIFGQTLLILGVVALLEQHPMPAPKTEKVGNS